MANSKLVCSYCRKPYGTKHEGFCLTIIDNAKEEYDNGE